MSVAIQRVRGSFLVRPLFFYALVFLLGGCARLMQAPEDQPRARALLETHIQANGELNRFKGLGHLHLSLPDVNMTGRLALAAEMPRKVRMEWLSALGQPLLRLTADGKTVSVFSSQTDKVHRLDQTDAVLERMVQIPISIDALLSLLAGRMPAYRYTAAQILQESDLHMAIALKDRWSATLAEVEVDLQDRQIKRLTAFDGDGSIRYQIDWLQWQRVQGYLLPRAMEVSVNGVQRAKLTMERYWCNVSLPDGIFSQDVPIQ